MKTANLILIAILVAVIVSASVLMMSFYIKEPTKVAGFSAYEKMKSIEHVRGIPGYEHVQLLSYVPEGFDFGPMVFRGKGDAHHLVTLFYSSMGNLYEDTKTSGFKIIFSNHVDSTWKERLQNPDGNYTVVDNGIISYQSDRVVYWSDYSVLTVYSKTLELDELEKILLSIFENEK